VCRFHYFAVWDFPVTNLKGERLWPIHLLQKFESSRSTSPLEAGRFVMGNCCPLARTPRLFSLLGTTYGGNGKSNFALP
jgi:hypothetical protein